MEEKINIAELLKDCPKGMELDCVMSDKVTFDYIDVSETDYPIVINTPIAPIRLTINGCYYKDDYAKCVIFPKGKTTWEGFQRPFKDGDVVTYKDRGVLVACIYKERKYSATFNHHIALYERGLGIVVNGKIGLTNDELCLATEEEKEKLFEAIQDNGYKWNDETKTLEKLVEPKFKVGDRIKEGKTIATVVRVCKDFYDIRLDSGGIGSFTIDLQDRWELVSNKFDITTLKSFESRVLIRDRNNEEWRGQFFSHYNNCSDRPYICIGNEGLSEYQQCIPYKCNEHLLGTTDDCDEYYKTWE